MSNLITYLAYDLVIESLIPCPELLTIERTIDSQVKIEFASVPDVLQFPRFVGYKFEASRKEILINTKFIAKILVTNGNRIAVEPRMQANEGMIRLLLFGWGIGALLHQRNILPLHGSGITTQNGAVIFCAPSGTGKSTIVSRFLKRGYKLIDDNIIALKVQDKTHMATPGYPQLKLRRDAFKDWEKEPFSLNAPIMFNDPKFMVNVRPFFENCAQPVRKIYVMTRNNATSLKIVPLHGASLFHALEMNTFCKQYLQGMGKLGWHFNELQKLAKNVPVYEVNLPNPMPSPDTLADALEKNFLE
ncbi:MAG: hypothetical protein HQK65_14360 [Desulfamplus sp.]|nr:hypothetical protein [Desulfamplus sp.]